MNTIKPTSDSVAQEFYRLMSNNRLKKEAQMKGAAVGMHPPDEALDGADEAKDDLSDRLDSAGEGDDATVLEDWIAALGGSLDEASDADYASDSALEDMLVDEAADDFKDGVAGIDLAEKLLGSIGDSLDSFANTSEKRVLAGLSKIADGLRNKGESFAADVVEATALSIHGDIKKSASSNSYITSELRKVATDLYLLDDQLSGDMVNITIDKIKNSTDA